MPICIDLQTALETLIARAASSYAEKNKRLFWIAKDGGQIWSAFQCLVDLINALFLASHLHRGIPFVSSRLADIAQQTVSKTLDLKTARYQGCIIEKEVEEWVSGQKKILFQESWLSVKAQVLVSKVQKTLSLGPSIARETIPDFLSSDRVLWRSALLATRVYAQAMLSELSLAKELAPLIGSEDEEKIEGFLRESFSLQVFLQKLDLAWRLWPEDVSPEDANQWVRREPEQAERIRKIELPLRLTDEDRQVLSALKKRGWLPSLLHAEYVSARYLQLMELVGEAARRS